MRALRVFAGLLSCILLASIAAGQGTKKVTTLYGEVIDIVSYVTNGIKPDTDERKAMAERNLRAGNPLGILEGGTGRIYLVAMESNSEDVGITLLNHTGTRIFAKGRVVKRGGVQLLLLTDIGKSLK